MRKFLFVFVLISSFLTQTYAQIKKPKSYALVIGVSEYEDPKITSLKHAHKDAGAFADFCAASSGLNIPADQMKVLTNEKASYWNIVDGLDWLKSSAQKDDQVYIYFAGHGDMESKELKYGYLLAHDSRYMNYLGRSLSLDLLNKTAHTLTVNKKAKVFLITDACHSGKLAGVDFNGSNLVALNLMQLVSNNEVRITSCNEGELSYEDEVWGDGRGAFSYFLTRGMSGEADGVGGKKDGNITIGEIKSYLNGKVPDNVRTVKKAKQNPVVMGTETTILNPFKSSAGSQNVAMAAQATNEISSNTGSRSASAESINVMEEDIMNAISSKAKDKNIDFKQLSSKPVSEIVNVLLKELTKSKKYNKKKLYSAQSQQIVAKTLYDKVQEIIDLYLSGDEEELEKRRYYSQVDKPYEQYPYMLEIAIKLLPKDHSLIPSLLMQKEYLTGLTYRLKVPFTKDYLVLIDTAFIHQQKALSIDSNAAYIHNEIGILNNYKKNYEQARYHFEKASVISPLWALPYSNLANLHLTVKDDSIAKNYVDLAINRQENIQSPYITNGSLYMNADNMLFAEEQFQKAIKINDRHFRPFDRLGDLYLKVQDYQASEQYYYEGALRKMGLNQESGIALDSDSDGIVDYLERELNSPINTTNWGRDVISCFAIGKINFDKQDFNNAKLWFEKVVNMDVENPLVYHYLGQISYSFQEFAQAEYYFKLAIAFHQQDSVFNNHVNNITFSEIKRGNRVPVEAFFYYTESKFDLCDPNIYLARTYEKWSYFTLAAKQYNECLILDPKNKIAYQMLWNMYKNRMELASAEAVMNRFGQIYPYQYNDVLTDYYIWALDIFKEDVQKTEYYAYKCGLLIYESVKESPETFFANFVRSFPNSAEKDEVIIDIDSDSHYDYTPNDFVIPHPVVDVTWIEPGGIGNPVFTGIDMLEKVKSISIDEMVKADVFAKLGDLYLYSNEIKAALGNYESSLNIKEDNHYLRSMAARCADYLYLFQKSFGHLTTMEQLDHLNFEDAVVLAQYYMKKGEKEKAINLSEEIANTHLFLKEDIEEDVIKLYLRFGDYQKAKELINHYIESDTTDMILQYMLARTYAALKKPHEALKHLQKADKLGFNLGFVYKNDTIFDPYRTSDEKWTSVQEKMEGYITSKM